MRKLLLSVILLSVLAACETKSPSGPTGLTPTTSTTTTSTMTTSPTTSSSTTTTIVLSSLARGYVAFNPPANTPSQATLFFERLLTGGAASLSLADGVPFGGPQTAQETENRYRVTGVYVMPNGTTGTITGILGGSSNPLETGGDFSGTLTAKTPSGCTAERPFAGRLNPQTLQWSGGEPGTSTCSPSPLAIPTINMLRSDPVAPLPPVPTTTSVTTTTTTTILCNYSVSPGSTTVQSAGGASQVSISAPAGCAWSAQSYADWIVVRPPQGGSGPATVVFDVQQNFTGAARSGTLLVAGIQVTVVQNPPQLPDLAPDAPMASSCSFAETNGEGPALATIIVRNNGPGDAPESTTRLEFDHMELPTPIVQTVTTPALGGTPPSFTTHVVPVDNSCWRIVSKDSSSVTYGCPITVISDYPGAIIETSEANNSATGTCTINVPISQLPTEGVGIGIRRVP